ncbi:MAG TPA: lysozyme, partial [Prochlorococcaceae cyanobacterium AMR_MDS_5431]|nr:lysozyme [Prochlorococcaceae cyanobacterium AMR_MDS_5431]
HGDTISQSAHLAALRELGFTATFYQNGNQATLEAMLRKNKPVPIGILHKGSISSPTGGGHWLVVIGQTETHFIVHDPFGELDLINGGYPKNGPTDGKQVAYTKKNLMKRWLISSNTDGWYWDIQ